MRLLVTLALFALAAFRPLPAQTLHSEKQVLANDLAGGYQVISCDVNNDGKPDLIALASGLPDLLWFENPTWQRHVLAANLPHMINAACWNRDRRTPPFIAVAYQFSTRPQESLGIVSVLTAGADPRQPWTPTEIDRLPTSHRLRWADIEGNGAQVLVNAPLADANAAAPDYRGYVSLVYYRPGEWKRIEIGSAEEGILHGIFVTGWDRTGRDRILIGSFLGISLYRFQPDRTWSREKISAGNPDPWPKSGTSDIAVGSLPQERFLAAIEPWHGTKVVVYHQRNQSWQREVIDDTLLDAHTIQAADLNRDGRDEVVAGFRGKPYGVYVYRWNGAKWNRQILSEGEVSASSCAIVNLDVNAAPTVACIGGATRNLVLYRHISD